MTNALALRPGVRVVAHGRLYQISAVVALERVLAIDVETQTQHTLRIQDLERCVNAAAVPDEAEPLAPELSTITDHDWRIAQARLNVIRPLLQSTPRTAAMVRRQAEQGGVHMVSLPVA